MVRPAGTTKYLLSHLASIAGVADSKRPTCFWRYPSIPGIAPEFAVVGGSKVTVSLCTRAGFGHGGVKGWGG